MTKETITNSNKRQKRPTVNKDGDLEVEGKVIKADIPEKEEKSKKEGEGKEEGAAEGEGKEKKEEESIETTRLYVMNLSYEVT